VPGSLDKKRGSRFRLSSIFFLIKDGTFFPLLCLMNPDLKDFFKEREERTAGIVQRKRGENRRNYLKGP
jgi:hypothetical protein